MFLFWKKKNLILEIFISIFEIFVIHMTPFCWRNAKFLSFLVYTGPFNVCSSLLSSGLQWTKKYVP